MSPRIVPGQVRDLFVQEWLACTLRTYPDQTGRFLHEERDPFRNPVGSTFRAAFDVLAAELFGAFDRTRVIKALDAVVRIRAVQDFTQAEAVAFVPLARDAVQRATCAGPSSVDPGVLALVESRIDELAILAAEALRACRDEIREIGARAARRRVFVPERVRARALSRAEAPPPPRGNTA
ncbi:MAG: RsbRD N-terminal domain-containing protein [Acidobacteriota bacterium]